MFVIVLFFMRVFFVLLLVFLLVILLFIKSIFGMSVICKIIVGFIGFFKNIFIKFFIVLKVFFFDSKVKKVKGKFNSWVIGYSNKYCQCFKGQLVDNSGIFDLDLEVEIFIIVSIGNGFFLVGGGGDSILIVIMIKFGRQVQKFDVYNLVVMEVVIKK